MFSTPRQSAGSIWSRSYWAQPRHRQRTRLLSHKCPTAFRPLASLMPQSWVMCTTASTVEELVPAFVFFLAIFTQETSFARSISSNLLCVFVTETTASETRVCSNSAMDSSSPCRPNHQVRFSLLSPPPPPSLGSLFHASRLTCHPTELVAVVCAVARQCPPHNPANAHNHPQPPISMTARHANCLQAAHNQRWS